MAFPRISRRIGVWRAFFLGLLIPSIVYLVHVPLILSRYKTHSQFNEIQNEVDGSSEKSLEPTGKLPGLQISSFDSNGMNVKVPQLEKAEQMAKKLNKSRSYDNNLTKSVHSKKPNITEILKAKKMNRLYLEMGNYIKLFKQSLIKAANDSKKGKAKEKQTIIEGNLKKELQEFEERQKGANPIQHYFDTLTMDIVNPYPYTYVINNKTLCSAGGGNLTYIIYVHSAPGNRKRRDNIRQSWGQVNLFTQFPSRIVFFVGLTSEKIQSDLDKESQLYGDIIQSNYKDAYRNLTFKAMGAMKWISDYCPNTKYVFKSDDDTYINMPALMHRLTHEFVNRTRFILGMIWRFPSLHIQRPGKLCSKWCIPFSILPGLDHYPTYASGSFYVMTQNLAKEIYDMAIRTPFFWVDDAYMSGIVVVRIPGLEHIDISKAFRFNIPIYKTSLDKEPHTLIVTLMKKPIELWKFHLPRVDKAELAILGKKRHAELLKASANLTDS